MLSNPLEVRADSHGGADTVDLVPYALKIKVVIGIYGLMNIYEAAVLRKQSKMMLARMMRNQARVIGITRRDAPSPDSLPIHEMGNNRAEHLGPACTLCTWWIVVMGDQG